MSGDTPYTLTSKQLSQFKKDGCIALPSISDEVTQNISQWAQEVECLPYQPDSWMHYDEVTENGHTILSRTENFAAYHKGFDALFRGDVILGILKQLSGEDMALFKDKINYKFPGGGGFKAHIDAPDYVHIANVKHLTILMAAQPATLENGCLEVVDGSHEMDVPLGKDVCIESSWCDQQKWTPVHLKAGEFLVFGSYLAHRSGPNLSDHGRAAIYATYNALSDGGDRHDAYYKHRREFWPATADRKPGEKYEEGARLYGFGTPMLTVDKATYKAMGL